MHVLCSWPWRTDLEGFLLCLCPGLPEWEVLAVLFGLNEGLGRVPNSY